MTITIEHRKERIFTPEPFGSSFYNFLLPVLMPQIITKQTPMIRAVQK